MKSLETTIGITIHQLQEYLNGWYHYGFISRDDLTSWGELVWKTENPEDNLVVLFIVDESHVILRFIDL